VPRPPRPEDLYDLRVPLEVAISPDGGRVAFTVKAANPRRDGYRTALWLAPADGSAPARQVTLGINSDSAPRWSPDGRTLAFLSDREAVLFKAGAGNDPGRREPLKEGTVQVWLLPMDGGEARQLTSLPQNVSDMRWSPDGSQLCLVSGARRAEREPERDPRLPPKVDTKLIDRLQFMLNAEGYIFEHPPKLWLVDVADGGLRRLTSGDARDGQPAWSPDGRRIAFVSNPQPDADLTWRTDIFVVDAAGGRPLRISGGRGNRAFELPAWSPDGSWLAALGQRYSARGTTRTDVWRFRVTDAGDDPGENLTGEHDLETAAAVNSDLFGFSPTRPQWTADGRQVFFGAPVDGSAELWRVSVEGHAVERLTHGRHYLSRADLARLADGASRLAAIRADAITPPDVVVLDVPSVAVGPAGVAARQLSRLMGEAWADIALVAPQERWHEVDGRRIQGWFYPAATSGDRPAPVVLEIHGGPATLYGWSLMWEWQCLIAGGMSVYASNPRGSQGYGQDFLSANYRDWGDGPMTDVMAGLDALIADGLADAERMGVTGGSYGGYLTSWIVGHTSRFKAAVSCRSVNDLTSEMLTGDIAGPLFGRYEYGANPWDDPELYRLHSPLTYADRMDTPLLIQHSENDLRTPITQGEELFTTLRSMHKPVRFLRVPGESHELTRSGAPFRRVDNVDKISAWFSHFLVAGKRGLPPIRRT
jgi:dipeptidyl aminopeptidase/acylaminoacyl peptidase